VAWQCRAARPADLPGLHALLHTTGAFPEAASAREVELRLWKVWQDTGWSPLNQVVATEGDRIVATLLYFPMGGRGVAVEPPHALPGVDPGVFLRAALPLLAPRFAWVQAALEQEEPAFSAGGLPVSAVLLSMERMGASADVGIRSQVPLEFVSGVPLEGILTGTLAGSLDVPAVTEVLKPAEMLESYRAGGSGASERWYEVRSGGEPAGCLLLDGQGDALVIQYLGVLPGKRGQGLGRALLRHAVREAHEGVFPRMRVTVDEANAPALSLYRGQGFLPGMRKVLHFSALGLESD